MTARLMEPKARRADAKFSGAAARASAACTTLPPGSGQLALTGLRSGRRQSHGRIREAACFWLYLVELVLRQRRALLVIGVEQVHARSANPAPSSFTGASVCTAMDA